MAGPLRIGLLLDSFVLPRWMVSIIEEIEAGDDARIALVIVNAAREQPRPLWRRLREMNLLYSVYNRIDQRLFARRSGQDAFEPVDVRPLLAGVEVREVMPLQKKWTDRFAPDDLDAVRAAQLDVMLRFGFRILRGGILSAARYGVWSFHHGDNRLYRGGPALFWEIYERNPRSGTVLQILTEELDGGKIIYRSQSSTDFTSLFRNRNATYWKTARFVARRLRDLRRDGLDAIVEDRAESRPEAGRGIYRLPGRAAMLRFFAQTAWSNVRAQFRNRTQLEQWFVAIAPRPERIAGAAPKFTVIDSPRDRFYADPFVVEHEGRTYLLIEDYSFRTRKGVISCIELRDGKPSAPRVVLERDYHLSYPSPFFWEGEWFMTPETFDNGTVELYRAVEFPWRWTLDRVLLSGLKAVDPTLFHHDGSCWLLVNVAPPGGSAHDELSLFFADSPRGPWQPHPRNPVVSDVRSARPAGAPFVEDGVLYRPAQNCALRYGHAITLNRVEAFTKTEYHETPVATIESSWLPHSLCTHTLNTSAHWLVTDGKRMRFGRVGRGHTG